MVLHPLAHVFTLIENDFRRRLLAAWDACLAMIEAGSEYIYIYIYRYICSVHIYICIHTYLELQVCPQLHLYMYLCMSASGMSVYLASCCRCLPGHYWNVSERGGGLIGSRAAAIPTPYLSYPTVPYYAII